MLKKMKNKKGFTLMEMLIVIAIIAVLVAVAIPTFSGSLTKAKEATDVANIRAYVAEVQLKNMVDDEALPAAYGGVTLNYNKLTWTKANTGVVTATYNGDKIDQTWTLTPMGTE